MSDDGGFSAWGWLGKAKAAVQDASTKLQDTVAVPTSLNKALDNMMSLEDPDKKTTKPEEYTPWSTVPAKWKARSGEWEALVKGLVGSEATFLIGPERGLTKLEVQTLKLQGVTVSFDTADAEQHYDRMSPDVLGYEPLSDMRFRLVPKFIKEEKFWVNYCWKVTQIAATENVQVQCRALLRVLNVMREDFPEEGNGAKIFARLGDRTQLLHEVDALISDVGTREEKREEQEEGERHRHAVRDLHEEGCEALKMLRDCLDDANMTEHLDMVQCFYDTCISCRDRLQEEVDGGSERAESAGADFSKLVDLVTQLDAAVASFDKRVRSGSADTHQATRSPKPSAMPSPPPPLADSPTLQTKGKGIHADPANPNDEEGVASVSADSYVHVPGNDRDHMSAKSRQSPADEQDIGDDDVAASPPAAAASKPAQPSSAKKADFSALPWDSDDE
eukprot:TRINITY_DN17383_c0_g2_i1.p1 TRINITY_DN17383_c0_g2~~TRINITY_DN17383_c0_g2_i1.p1  ORF type:complete len:447 (+),score=150.63 TRINITY_DN17383_c0_g2_i1:109-1449(+)